jgi:hypothetical protein
MTEDEDVYRFLTEAAADVGGRFVRIADGRDVWQVFRDVRMIGNTRADPCSRILKRQLTRTWLSENCDPTTTTIHIGFGWDEETRIEKARRFWGAWAVDFPLTWRPLPSLGRPAVMAAVRANGLEPPRAYEQGFAHANCGGFCVKAGQGHFKLLLEQMPDRYRYHEGKEQEMRDYLGKDVAILRDRRGGETKPLTLRAFRERIEQGAAVDETDIGGCACFAPSEEELRQLELF